MFVRVYVLHVGTQKLDDKKYAMLREKEKKNLVKNDDDEKKTKRYAPTPRQRIRKDGKVKAIFENFDFENYYTYLLGL